MIQAGITRFTRTATAIASLFIGIGAYASSPAMHEENPRAVEAGIGEAKFTPLFQAWAVSDTSQKRSTFRIRRVQLEFKGSLTENTRWFVMIDPAKSLALNPGGDNKTLQDLGLAYRITPQLEFVIGQFKVQTTSEGLQSSSELLFPERSSVTRQVGDPREMGAKIEFNHEKLVKLTAMISNGTPTNAEDANVAKDLSLRAEFRALENFTLGGFLIAEDFKFSDKSALGVNITWQAPGELFRAEIIQERSRTVSGLRLGSGYVLDIAHSIFKNLEPALRYEKYKPDGDQEFSSSAFTLGANYFIREHKAKIQLAYTLLFDMSSQNGTYSPARTSTPRERVLIANFQMAL